MPRLIVEDLHAGYGHDVGVLHGVSLEVGDGETVVLLGTNGNGKSTLMKCVMGLLAPRSGRVLYESEPGADPIDLTGRPAHARAKLASPWWRRVAGSFPSSPRRKTSSSAPIRARPAPAWPAT